MTKPGIKAVVFDWAGTTVDFGSFAPTAVFINLFQQVGITITPLQARSGMGMMKKDHLHHILNLEDVTTQWVTRFGDNPTEKDVTELFDNFIPMQNQSLTAYAKPIRGLDVVMRYLRENDIKVGSTTGYLRGMMDILIPKAAEYGYSPDVVVCSDEAPNGRPYPWMCYQNAIQLGVYPMSEMVKVGDTIIDIQEGINAGMISVGISVTGNMMGLIEEEIEKMPKEAFDKINAAVKEEMYAAGAHYVVDGIWDLPALIETINAEMITRK